MTRKMSPAIAAPAAPPLPAAPVIGTNQVFTPESARRILGLPASTLKREIRSRRLRVAKRAGRYFILGAWLLEWLKAGEMRREHPPADPNPNKETI